MPQFLGCRKPSTALWYCVQLYIWMSISRILCCSDSCYYLLAKRVRISSGATELNSQVNGREDWEVEAVSDRQACWRDGSFRSHWLFHAVTPDVLLLHGVSVANLGLDLFPHTFSVNLLWLCHSLAYNLICYTAPADCPSKYFAVDCVLDIILSSGAIHQY